MEPSELPGAIAERIRAALRDDGIDDSYVAFVARHVDADDATWRWCCGSQCDPCVARLGRVVDTARRWLAPPDAPPSA